MIHTRPKTKIVCTLGPSTASSEVIRSLIEEGMSVARLNMSHGGIDDHIESLRMVREASEGVGIPVAVMVDVPGPKYRTGPLVDGVLNLEKGDRITLTSRDIAGTKEIVSVSPPGIHRDAATGTPLLLDDGLMELAVESVEGEDVHCTVVRGGRLTEKRGVAVPGRTPSQPFPTEKALDALKFAAEHKADFVAISMVSTAANVDAARAILRNNGHEPFIISKIELAGAIERFGEILDASDGIMVARGDMGVEVRLAEVPVIQKRLISLCNERGKPVITATQMLESMVRSPVPTRAEVTDVANAIFDGTDAIMLSGETSVGEHPIPAVRVMAEVAMVAEADLPYERILADRQEHQEDKVDDAIAYDACHTAQQLGSKLIVAFTESGGTAGRVSKYRPKAHIVALTPNEDVLRKLVLRWGVTPYNVPSITQIDGFFDLAAQYAKEEGGAENGESIVLVAGLPIGVSGGTNLLRVLSIA
jgi:pyruvate kinase